MRRFFRRTNSGLFLIAVLIVAATLACPSLSVARTNRADHAGVNAADSVTVLLKSGETIPNAAYAVDKRFNVLRLQLAGGKTRAVSFSEIATITAGGVDVTERILGRGYGAVAVPQAQPVPSPVPQTQRPAEGAPPDTIHPAAEPVSEEEAIPAEEPATDDQRATRETWLSETDESYRAARSSIWKLAVRGAGNYSAPFGDYYEGVTSGAGFGGDVFIAVNYQVGVWLSVSKSGMKWDEGEFYFYSIDPDLTIIGQDFGLSAVRFRVGAMVYKHFGKDPADRSMLYAYSGLGAIRHKMTADVRARQESTGDIFVLSGEDTQTKFLTSIGGGVVKALTPHLGVDFELTLDTVWAGSSDTYTGYWAASFGWIADVQGGLLVFF